jgi:hypothetical protein
MAHLKNPGLAQRAGKKGGLATSRNYAGGSKAWGKAMANASHSHIKKDFTYIRSKDGSSNLETTLATPTS